ncbi:MAG: acylphosphatase [Bacteroidales bacterium]|nr:acylphosphatase [Bacteroidales bacterium]MCF8388717.1 acylphosphatase [Bacteroidales bacterium]MCF8399708.1 acylphosphatase [Bacteroidales bacterium]
MAKSKNTDRKEVLKIQLSGSLNTEINYVFEIYRQAVLLKLTGYIENQSNGVLNIIISGQCALTEQFIAWLKLFTGKSIELKIEKSPNQIIYNEFRIIKNKYHKK